VTEQDASESWITLLTPPGFSHDSTPPVFHVNSWPSDPSAAGSVYSTSATCACVFNVVPKESSGVLIFSSGAIPDEYQGDSSKFPLCIVVYAGYPNHGKSSVRFNQGCKPLLEALNACRLVPPPTDASSNVRKLLGLGPMVFVNVVLKLPPDERAS
jgi:hypothetical protein